VAKLPQLVKLLKSLNDWQSIFCSNLRNWGNPCNSNYHMSINNCQAIQKSCIDRKSNAWFTLGSENKTLVSLGRSRFSNYWMTDSPSLFTVVYCICGFSIATSKLLVFSVFENLILHIFLIIIIIIHVLGCSEMFRNVPCFIDGCMNMRLLA